MLESGGDITFFLQSEAKRAFKAAIYTKNYQTSWHLCKVDKGSVINYNQEYNKIIRREAQYHPPRVIFLRRYL